MTKTLLEQRFDPTDTSQYPTVTKGVKKFEPKDSGPGGGGGKSHGGGGGKSQGVPGGKEFTGDPKANAMDGKPGQKPQKGKKKKSGPGPAPGQGIGPKKGPGAGGEEEDKEKQSKKSEPGDDTQDKQPEGDKTSTEDGKRQQSLKKAAIRLRGLDKFVPIPGRESNGTFDDLERATGTKDLEEKVMDVFDNSQWMLVYNAGEGNFVYTNYSFSSKDGNASTINSIFKNIMPASGKISNAPTSAFQYIIAIKQLLRIKFDDPKSKSIVKGMNSRLEKISNDLSSYYSIIKNNPKTQFDQDLISSANKVKSRVKNDPVYASNVSSGLKKSIFGDGQTAIAKKPTIQKECKAMNQNDIRKLIQEAFTDKVYGKYPYSHRSGDDQEPAQDYVEDWKRFCLEMVQDKSKQTAIAIAKLLVKDIELFEDVLDLAGQNQSVGSEILRKMEESKKDML